MVRAAARRAGCSGRSLRRREEHFIVYADGSCIGNPGPGGWGVIIVAPDGSRRELSGSAPATTNNRMELTAAIEGLRRVEPKARVILRSDSQYLINSMTLGWKRRLNLDLWRLLDAEVAAREVQFEWVMGHASDALNNRADELARAAAINQQRSAAPAG